MIISKRNSFLVLIVPDMKCSYLSVLLVYATQCTANYVALAILIGMYQLINYIHARRGNAWVHICSVTQQSSRTAPLQAQSAIQFRIASPATRDCLSWHWILWHLLLVKPMLNDYSRCVVNGDLTARKQNRTRMSQYRRVKLNGYILHWTRCTVNWSVTCFWWCRRTAEVAETAFLTFTDLLGHWSCHISIYVETKTKMPPKL